MTDTIWAAPSEFGTYRLCEQRWFRRACACAPSRQNLRWSLIQAMSQEEPPDRKPDPWPLWMAGHAQLKFVMTECLKTQIRLTGLILKLNASLRLVFSIAKRNYWIQLQVNSQAARTKTSTERLENSLIHISLASRFGALGKQCTPRCLI